MVNQKEWLTAPETTMFENKDNHNRISKPTLRANLKQIEMYMIQQHVQKGEVPTKENIHRIQDLIASVLENFEVVDITKKETEKGVIIPEKPAGHIPSHDKKGEFCFKCGLQKEDTEIIDKDGIAIRICKECLGI